MNIQYSYFQLFQDSLFFLRRFFEEFSDDEPPKAADPSPTVPVPVPKAAGPLPVMTVAQTADNEMRPEDRVKFDEMLEALEEEASGEEDSGSKERSVIENEDEDVEGAPREQPTFFKWEISTWFWLSTEFW